MRTAGLRIYRFSNPLLLLLLLPVALIVLAVLAVVFIGSVFVPKRRIKMKAPPRPATGSISKNGAIEADYHVIADVAPGELRPSSPFRPSSPRQSV